MERHGSWAALQRVACQLLASFTQPGPGEAGSALEGAHCRGILSQDGRQAVLRAMQHHQTDAAVQQYACMALTLSTQPHPQTQLDAVRTAE